MRKLLLITGLCCALAFVPTPAARAKATDQKTSDHQRIKALEARVAALEQRLGMPPVSSAPSPHQQASVAPAPTAAAPTPTPTPPATAVAASPTTADWSQLHRGMTPREVTAQIGPPDHKQIRPMSEI